MVNRAVFGMHSHGNMQIYILNGFIKYFKRLSVTKAIFKTVHEKKVKL